MKKRIYSHLVIINIVKPYEVPKVIKHFLYVIPGILVIKNELFIFPIFIFNYDKLNIYTNMLEKDLNAYVAKFSFRKL